MAALFSWSASWFFAPHLSSTGFLLEKQRWWTNSSWFVTESLPLDKHYNQVTDVSSPLQDSSLISGTCTSRGGEDTAWGKGKFTKWAAQSVCTRRELPSTQIKQLFSSSCLFSPSLTHIVTVAGTGHLFPPLSELLTISTPGPANPTVLYQLLYCTPSWMDSWSSAAVSLTDFHGSAMKKSLFIKISMSEVSSCRHCPWKDTHFIFILFLLRIPEVFLPLFSKVEMNALQYVFMNTWEEGGSLLEI